MYNDNVYNGVSMSEMMVRKQTYLPRRQNLLPQAAGQRARVSEAEVIRQALERRPKFLHSVLIATRPGRESQVCQGTWIGVCWPG
jgi:hypothetical protein